MCEREMSKMYVSAKVKKKTSACRAHCLVLAFPAQGHINPMLEFSKRLEHKGSSVKVTLVTTLFTSKNMNKEGSPIAVETISDGFDEGGIAQAESMQSYLERFWRVGPQTLTQLIEKLSNSGCPVNCIVYDTFLTWALDIAKKYGLFGVAFFTQSCAVDTIYHHVNKGVLKLPLLEPEILQLPGLPPLEPQDMPSLGSYPAFFDMTLDQFSNVHKADWVLCNTFYELEQEAVDYWMSKIMPLRTVGPTIPSMFLDKRLEGDKNYDLSVFKPNVLDANCLKWLNDRPKGSVVYVSFGSLVVLGDEQMQELAWGLRMSNSYFLWVVRSTELAKLPKNFVEETSDKGLVVNWCPQLEVLAHEAVGCFLTHCGWNSTLEALSIGVPMVAMPQRTDQSTNAKYITDIWKMGLKTPVDEKGLVRREAAEHCLREIMEGQRGKEIKKNAYKWRKLAKEAVDKGGSSNKNIEEFVAKLVRS